MENISCLISSLASLISFFLIRFSASLRLSHSVN